MNEAIAIRPTENFSDLHFTQSATGHLASPWWSYDWRAHNDGMALYQIGSRFHEIRRQSIYAFAEALGIQASDVMVSECDDLMTGNKEWRLSTRRPVQVQEPKKEEIVIAPTQGAGVVCKLNPPPGVKLFGAIGEKRVPPAGGDVAIDI